MRTKLAIVAAALTGAFASVASAQMYYGRTYDPYYNRYDERVVVAQECWNPRAGHFEALRPGEYQGDLDMSRCRAIGNPVYAQREWRGDWRGDYRGGREECWNPRARHFEEVRPNEVQNDLDFTRCRINR
jgi:hypothetical protein